MIKYLSLITYMLIGATAVPAQSYHSDVVNHLSNKKYGDSTGVSVYVDDSNINISAELSKEISQAFFTTIENLDLFKVVKPMQLREKGRSIDLSDSIATQYVLICQLNQVLQIDKKKDNPYSLIATLRCIDIVTGITIMAESMYAIYPNARHNGFYSADKQIQKLKPFKSKVKEVLFTTFHPVDWIRHVDFTGKKHIPSVFLDLEMHNKSRKPLRLNAFIVDDIIVRGGEKTIIFKQVGKLHKPFLNKSNRDWIGYHIKKGKDDIFELVENGVRIYASPLNLGE